MPKDRDQDHPGLPRPRRQVPISCNFCRSSKLRCSRGQPCTNCAARKIPCRQDYALPSRPSSGPDPIQLDILERLRRIEEAVVPQHSLPHHPIPHQTLPHHSHPNLPTNFPSQDETDACPSKQVPAVHADVAWLEQVSMDDVPSSNRYRDMLAFDIGPMKCALKAPRFMFDPSSSQKVTKYIWLPEHAEAKTIIARYPRYLGYLIYVGYMPNLPSMIDTIYERLNSQQSPQLGPIALFLSIIACTSFTWDDTGDDDVGLTSAQANDQTALWTKFTQDVIEAAQSAKDLSLELVQAMIALSFVIANMQGLAMEYRALISSAILISRELGLHLVDHPRNQSKGTALEKEMKRRAWWYLVSTDWLIACRFDVLGDSHYQCHPCHMVVNKPLNIKDEDFVDDTMPKERPLTDFTHMAFFLCRLRLAELCRSYVDRNVLAHCSTSAPKYPDILTTDAELDKFVHDLPPYFNLEFLAGPLAACSKSALAATIASQAYMLHMIYQHLRCRLHLPYLTADQRNPSYARSRSICLTSARFILQVGLQTLGGDHKAVLPKRFCYSCCFNGFFLASIVLVMDFCTNVIPCSNAAEQARNGSDIVLIIDFCNNVIPVKETTELAKNGADVVDALRLLERAKIQSRTAARVLESLKQLLRRYEVALPSNMGVMLEEATGEGWKVPVKENENAGNAVRVSENKTEGVGGKSGYFDEMAARMGDLMELDGVGLTDFLDGLDSTFF